MFTCPQADADNIEAHFGYADSDPHNMFVVLASFEEPISTLHGNVSVVLKRDRRAVGS